MCDHAGKTRPHLKRNSFAEELARRFAEQFAANTWFRPGLKIGVGVSGGADSIALLRMLIESSAELGIVVSAVHFNHQLRGKASETDQAFVTALAEKFGVHPTTIRRWIEAEEKRFHESHASRANPNEMRSAE